MPGTRGQTLFPDLRVTSQSSTAITRCLIVATHLTNQLRKEANWNYVFYVIKKLNEETTLLAVNVEDRCKLFCRVSTSTAYYQLAERVTDGTKCGPHSSDVCVMGQCRVRSENLLCKFNDSLIKKTVG